MGSNGRTSILPRFGILVRQGLLTRVASVLLCLFKIDHCVGAYCPHRTQDELARSTGRARDDNLPYAIYSRGSRSLSAICPGKSVVSYNGVARALNRLVRLSNGVISNIRFHAFRAKQTGGVTRALRSAFQRVSTLCLALVSGDSAIALANFIRSQDKGGGYSALVLGVPRRFPRLLTQGEVRANDQLIRGGGLQLVGRHAARDGFLLRSPKWDSYPTFARELCLLVSVFRRVMIFAGNHVGRNDRGVGVLLRYRVLVRQGTSERVSRLLPSLFMILRSVRSIRYDYPTVNRRRYNRCPRRDTLAYSIQTSGARWFTKVCEGNDAFRNFCLPMAFHRIVCECD